MLPIPESLNQVTSAWLTEVLRQSKHLEQGSVTVTRVERIGTDSGYASIVGRVHLSGPDSLPRSLIVKLHTASDNADRGVLLREKYVLEAEFYSRVWPKVGCRTPGCYAVAHRVEPPRFLLVMEDLEGARFGDAAEGWTQKDAEGVVDALASLHATWWDRPEPAAWDWLSPYGDAASQLEKFLARRDTFMERYGEVVSPELKALTMAVGPEHAELIRKLGGFPQTLLHVDTHLDNIAFVSEGGAEHPVLFDWQGVARGLGVVDLCAFLLGGSTEARRAAESDLVRRYHRALVQGGVQDYAPGQLQSDYRCAVFRRWVGTVNGMGSSYAAAWTGRQAETARQAVREWNATAEDHTLYELIQNT